MIIKNDIINNQVPIINNQVPESFNILYIYVPRMTN